MMGLIALILAGGFEVMMVYSLNRTQGFKNKFWCFIVFVFAGLSLASLSFAMKTYEAGVAYSIWVAFGSIGAILLGLFCFKEKINLRQIAWMIVIIISVIGLKLFA